MRYASRGPCLRRHSTCLGVERKNWKRNTILWIEVRYLFIRYLFSYFIGRLHMCCDTRSNNLTAEILMGYLDSDNISCEEKQRIGGKITLIIFTNWGINNLLHKSHISANRRTRKTVWADAGMCNIRSCHTLSTVLPSWCRNAKFTD
jgi:hypothetical protein